MDINSFVIGHSKGYNKGKNLAGVVSMEENEAGGISYELKANEPKSKIFEKDVNFYDYDGTLLYAYTVEEAQALTELPPLPEQPGLICQEWNYDLATIKEYNREVDVGATYITDDGKTRLYIKIAAEGRMDVPLCFSQTVAHGVTIDWGDGSATETLDGTGNVNTTHTYASIGEYVITLGVADGCRLNFGHGDSKINIMGTHLNHVYSNMLKGVEIGSGVTSINIYAFQHCYSLSRIVIPNSIKTLYNYTFYYCYSLSSIVIPNSVEGSIGSTFTYCYSLKRVVIPNGITGIYSRTFNGCKSLSSIVMPNSVKSIDTYVFCSDNALTSIVISNGVTSISNYAFEDCYSLASIVIPNKLKTISPNTFDGCLGMKFYDFTQHTAVPTLSSKNAFNSMPADCEIRVPAALYDEWIAATNWSSLASQIVGV